MLRAPPLYPENEPGRFGFRFLDEIRGKIRKLLQFFALQPRWTWRSVLIFPPPFSPPSVAGTGLGLYGGLALDLAVRLIH